MTTHIDYVQRPLMTVDEVLRMKAPVKEGKRIIDPGDMLIFITGHRPIYGRQMLYFFDPVFMERAKIRPPKRLPSLQRSQKQQIVDQLAASAEKSVA